MGKSLSWDRYHSSDGRIGAARSCSPCQQGGPQPAVSADGRLIIFLNGELYNDDLIEKDQAQAVLNAYLSEGEELFVRLNGTYALLLIEPSAQRLRLICDRSASQPIFYLKTGDHLAFSTRLKPLTCLPHWNPRISGPALASFLSSGYLVQGQTLWNGVAQLGPGQMLILDSTGVKVRQYWDFTLSSHVRVGDEGAYSEELSRLLLHSVERRSRDGDQLGVLLSGGYDSRAIAGSMRRVWPDRVLQTITWGEDAEKPGSDALIAAQLAEHIGAKHTFFNLNASALPDHFRSFVRLDEGRTDAVGNYPESLSIFERIQAELGLGILLRGDECFGWKEDVGRDSEMLHSLEIHELSKLTDSYTYLDSGIRRTLVEVDQRQIRGLLAASPYLELHDRKDYLYFTQRLWGYLNPLTQLKQVEMDLRNPFLDNEILDFIGLLPMKLRLGKTLFKATVERLFPEFKTFDFAKQSSLIDWDQRLGSDSGLQNYIRTILLKQKNGFDEIINRRKLERFLERAFATAASRDRQEVRKPKVWRRMKRKMLRRQGYYELSPCTQIFRLMILKIWTDEFMNGDFDLSSEDD